MWFFRSIELLPRPSFIGLAPTLAMLGVWAMFEGTTPVLFGRPVLPLWLALVTYFALSIAARLPGLLARGDVGHEARAGVHLAAAGIAVVLAAGFFVRDPWVIQIAWLAGWLGYTGLFVGTLLMFDDDDLALMPYRWASRHPFNREAMRLVAVRLALVALAASWITAHAGLTDWVLFVTLGRLGLFYVFEWVTILFALSLRDGDS